MYCVLESDQNQNVTSVIGPFETAAGGDQYVNELIASLTEPFSVRYENGIVHVYDGEGQPAWYETVHVSSPDMYKNIVSLAPKEEHEEEGGVTISQVLQILLDTTRNLNEVIVRMAELDSQVKNLRMRVTELEIAAE